MVEVVQIVYASEEEEQRNNEGEGFPRKLGRFLLASVYFASGAPEVVLFAASNFSRRSVS